MKLKSPLTGSSYKKLTTDVEADLGEHADNLAALRGFDSEDLEAYLKKLSKLDAKRQLLGLVEAESPEDAVFSLERDLAGAGMALAEIYRDGIVDERECAALRELVPLLDTVLALEDEDALKKLPTSIQEKLEEFLFRPAEALATAAQEQYLEVTEAVAQRDAPSLKKIIAASEQKSEHTVAQLLEHNSLRGLDRYAPGDLVALGPDAEDGLGVVVGVDVNGLQVEAVVDGRVELVMLSLDDLIYYNALKLGDQITDATGFVYGATALNEDGRMIGSLQHPDGQVEAIDADELEGAILALAAEAGLPAPSSKRHDKPILCVSGGKQTPEVEALGGPGISGGLYTSRGPSKKEHGVAYARYNEDAALLGFVESEDANLPFFGVCDQAGGMGKIRGQTGAASEIAVQALEEAAQQIAEGSAPAEALEEAAQNARKRILEINRKHDSTAMTTMTGGVLKENHAHLLNVGDSQAWHFSADGKLNNATRPQCAGDDVIEETGDPNAGLEYAHLVTSAVGTWELPQVDLYEWEVEAGDFIVFVSDGVADANLYAQWEAYETDDPWTRSGSEVTARHLGALIAGADSGALATRAIRDYALAQMREGKGKPDNIAVVAVQIREH